MENLTLALPGLKLLCQQERLHQRLEQSANPAKFNVFRLLRRQSDELSHSDFIGSLLDPSAEHGQGDIFLSSFLALLKRRGAASNIVTEGSLEHWSVQREKSTDWGAWISCFRRNGHAH
jgi:hypothetical protein